MLNRDRLRAVEAPGGVAKAGRAGRSPVVLTKVRRPSSASMPVQRLDALLDRAFEYRLVLIVAPAGSGKTALLARFATHARTPVGWYRAEAWDSDEDALVQHLEAALVPQLPGVQDGWGSVADVANALHAWPGGPVILFVDELHALEGTPAEAALEQLIDYAPATLTIVAATRVPPRFNLPRLRVSGMLMEISSDDLRFRSWEVERLFRDHYHEPLPPEELARLARRTDGWAAGLQLFHLATRGRPADERRRVLAGIGPNAALMRDYLTRNVLEQLPAELRRFLLETSVLGRLSADLCDRLLGHGGAAEMLAELERRNLFTYALADEGLYRYHEVLRSYLHGVLLDEVGEHGLRQRFSRAGELLVEADAVPEALEAFCRAEEWATVQALAGHDDAQAAGTSGAWLDALPPTVLRHDPWLLMASARRLRADGRFSAAISRYQQAEEAFGRNDPAAVCRDEARTISAWLDPGYGPPPRGWPALLRAAVERDPLQAARGVSASDEHSARVAGGLAALLSGRVIEAQRMLLDVADDDRAGPVARAVASLGAAIAGMLAGQRSSAEALEGAVVAAEVLGLDWLARLGRASLAIGGTDESISEAHAVAVACDALEDRWGAALARMSAAWGARHGHDESDDLERATREFRALGAPVLEAWAHGLGALRSARAGAPDALESARQAEAMARSAGSPDARALAYLAMATCLPASAGEYMDLVDGIAGETGLRLSVEPANEVRADAGGTSVGERIDASQRGLSAPPLRIRLLGRFEFELAGRRVDLAGVRPRVRSLLHLLSLEADRPIHHETIEAALWPGADPAAASRNLHVAVASLRRVLEPSATRSFRLIRREGDGYRLVVPPGGEIDAQRFEAALAIARTARQRGHPSVAGEAFGGALDVYRGDLLPEEGPAEWVTERRELLRMMYVEAAQSLAELLLERGDANEAARVCSQGLQIERYHDPLWRLLIQARDRAGDAGAATRARLGYDQMLAELGVERESPGHVPAQ